MRHVPEGRITAVNQLRTTIGQQQGAAIGCPLTKGVFAWTAARAAAEDETEGHRPFTP